MLGIQLFVLSWLRFDRSGLKATDLIYDPTTSTHYSDSSDFDQEEDEDSNDEQFYKNDYPEQEAEASEDELEAIDQAWVEGDYTREAKLKGMRVGEPALGESEDEADEGGSESEESSDY